MASVLRVDQRGFILPKTRWVHHDKPDYAPWIDVIVARKQSSYCLLMHQRRAGKLTEY